MKYFGTDGIRGVANQELTPEFAVRLGRALAQVVDTGQVLIGRDTRLSGDMLEGALTAGLLSAGRPVTSIGIVPTPALAMLTRERQASLGVMISASHNPIEDNGFKCFDQDGFKLADELEAAVEAALDDDRGPRMTHTALPMRDVDERMIERYQAAIIAMGTSLHGRRVIIDAAYGAAYACAPFILRALDADVSVLHGEADGSRINVRCGATDLRVLADAVRHANQQGISTIGIAFDGDADRVKFVDETGREVDGDAILLALALNLHKEELLAQRAVVGTVMNNVAFERILDEHGITLLRTPVGDRYVLERMRATGAIFGGEPSGHVIDLRHNTTGDGPATAVAILSAMVREKKPLHELTGMYRPAPQVLLNVRVSERDNRHKNPALSAAIAQAQLRLGRGGRILIRPSGTEPLIRVMVEGEDERLVHELAESLAAAVTALKPC